jgi:hypothetical protein
MKAVWLGLGLIAMLTNCGHIDLNSPTPSSPTSGPTSGPTTSASASPTSSPTTACGTPSADANNVFVAMANGIGAVNDPTYQTLYGYGVVDPSGDVPEQASVISETSLGDPLTSSNTLQFYNAEAAGSTTLHSAFGFSKSFPGEPFAFPSPAPSPTASAIGHNAWFTGRIASPADTICYSQTFTLSPGTYYFGDYDLYNTIEFRDVIVVSTPSARIRLSHARANAVRERVRSPHRLPRAK